MIVPLWLRRLCWKIRRPAFSVIVYPSGREYGSLEEAVAHEGRDIEWTDGAEIEVEPDD